MKEWLLFIMKSEYFALVSVLLGSMVKTWLDTKMFKGAKFDNISLDRNFLVIGIGLILLRVFN